LEISNVEVPISFGMGYSIHLSMYFGYLEGYVLI